MNTVEMIAQLRMHWWVEVLTVEPCCTYYFGPFRNVCEAILAKPGYLENLVQEGAEEISVQIKWCRPKDLTIFGDVATEGELTQLCLTALKNLLAPAPADSLCPSTPTRLINVVVFYSEANQFGAILGLGFM